VIVAAGMQIVEAAEVDVAAFKAAAAPIVAREAQTIGRDVLAQLQA
jgi:hypothetical protein